MRHANPEAGKISRGIVKVTTANDYLPFGFTSSVGSLILISVALGMTFDAGQPLGLLLLIPVLVPVWMLAVLFTRSTKSSESSSHSQDNVVAVSSVLYDQIRGSDTESLALPIIKKIYAHAREGRHGYFGDCRPGTCDDRVTVLRKLVPAHKSVTSTADLDAAKQYIKMVEDAERNHKKMLKELGEV